MVISLSMWPPRRRPNKTGARTASKPFLNDSQWNLIKDLFPKPRKSHAGGRPPIQPRTCLEGIIWVLKAGARWQNLPDRYPSGSTCWRRHKEWTEAGIIEKAWQSLLKRMDRRKLLHWAQAMGDGTFPPAKKALMLGRPGRGSRIMVMVDGQGIPVSRFVTSAQVAEVNTVETLVDLRLCGGEIKRLTYDKAADADWLRDSLEHLGIELVCPHRRGRTRVRRQDGRKLRRYRLAGSWSGRLVGCSTIVG